LKGILSGKTEADFNDHYEFRRYQETMMSLAAPLAPFYLNSAKGKFAVNVDPKPIKSMMEREFSE
jgi:hypothetical protein